MKDSYSQYCPIFLTIKGKKCVVIGGGRVALRKVKMLLDYGAKVEVVSPQLCAELATLAREVAIPVHEREYRSVDLKDAIIAISATNDRQTNLAVAKEARSRGVLVNSVDDAKNSDFIAPSSFRRGDITIAISTNGRSPALARKLRTRLEKELVDEYAALAKLISEVRAELKQKGIRVNAKTWQEAIDLDGLIEMLKKGKKEKAREALLEALLIGKEG